MVALRGLFSSRQPETSSVVNLAAGAGSDYQKAQKETLDRQLATGGLRLAALLNAVLGGQ